MPLLIAGSQERRAGVRVQGSGVGGGGGGGGGRFVKGNTGIERESGMSRTHKNLSLFLSLSLYFSLFLSTYIPRVT